MPPFLVSSCSLSDLWQGCFNLPQHADPPGHAIAAGYLFPEIGRRRNAYLEANPDAQPIISLGIGDTTMPVPEHILNGLKQGASNLGAKETYSGYGPEQGIAALRGKISDALYDGKVAPDEVFVSDGSKCDIGRLQMMFGAGVTTAVQDPSYPVYVDTSVIMGQTGTMDDSKKQYGGIVYMPCNPDNNFFPDLANTPRADVIYFCSPNNPTGATATREQLQELVDYANENGSIIVFDAAYAPFISSPDVPKSIFQIPGARTCAIEVNSFSKYAGFTGVRLGWTIIPKELTYADGSPVAADFNRIMCTAFNGGRLQRAPRAPYPCRAPLHSPLFILPTVPTLHSPLFRVPPLYSSPWPT